MHLFTIITQIDREREGEQIDRALLKNVLGIFVEIGMGNMDAYETDFETSMLQDTAAYYSRKAASWIEEDSCPDYMLKVLEHILYILSFHENLFCMPQLLPSCSVSIWCSLLWCKMSVGCRLRSVWKERRKGLAIICMRAVNRSCWR